MWLLDPKSDLAKQLQAHMETWKGKAQQGQAHPDGPARWTVGAVLAKWVLSDTDHKKTCPKFAEMHDKMESLEEMRDSIQLAFAKPVKDGRVILKARPQMSTQESWVEVFSLLDSQSFCESKDVAPPGPTDTRSDPR